jgi:hypothetical protein
MDAHTEIISISRLFCLSIHVKGRTDIFTIKHETLPLKLLQISNFQPHQPTIKPKTSRLALGPNQPLIQRVLEVLCPGRKQLKHDGATHLHLVPWLRMSIATPVHAFTACKGTTATFDYGASPQTQGCFHVATYI